MQPISKKSTWLIPVILLALMALVVWLSPEERTLGARIKIVYVHVAFVWTGLGCILITGVLGAGVLITQPAHWLVKLLPILSLTGLIFFAIGFILSLLAAKINWGGILWTEPRTIAAMKILSMAMIVQILAHWIMVVRMRALMYMGLLIFTIITNGMVTKAVHPTNPIFSSKSHNFAIAVLTLTGIVIVLALWFMWIKYHTDTAEQLSPAS